MGAKIIPMMKSVGRTVLGVSIGCHALSLCCLKAVSTKLCQILNKKESDNDKLAGRFQLPFSFLSEESAESESCLFFLLKRPMDGSMERS